jgi:hypothetical protein
VLGLARFAMKSPLHTGILAALLAVVPLLYVFSAALVALATLRHGLTAGTRILVFAFIGGLVSWQLSGVPLSLVVLAMGAILAVVLRETQSWSRTLLVGSVLGVVLAFLAQALFQEQFSALIESVRSMMIIDEQGSAQWQVFESLKPVVGYMILGSQLMETLLALLLARYWQAGLYNPGGLKAEMHQLRFTAQEAVVLIVAVALALFLQPAAMMLFGIPFIFAGLAFMHGIVAKLKLGGQWLVALYIAMLPFNQIIVPLLVLIVLVDSFVDIRSRVAERPGSDDE